MRKLLEVLKGRLEALKDCVDVSVEIGLERWFSEKTLDTLEGLLETTMFFLLPLVIVCGVLPAGLIMNNDLGLPQRLPPTPGNEFMALVGTFVTLFGLCLWPLVMWALSRVSDVLYFKQERSKRRLKGR